MPNPMPPSCLPAPFEWIYIPGGETRLRYPHSDKYSPFAELVIVNVQPFYMAKYPITNAQFAVFVNETGHQPQMPPTVRRIAPEFQQPLQPIIDLQWQEAMAFCEWLSEKVGYRITLPTNAQWRRAAQGDDDRKYPWGNEWDDECCNTEESCIGCTTPVTQYPQGASPYGVMDMAGNIYEWCLTDWDTGSNSLDYDFPEELWMETQRVFAGSDYGTSKGSLDLKRYGGGAIAIAFTYSTGIRLVTA